MGLKLVAEIYKYFNKYVPPYMAYGQNMIKFSCGWSWRKLQNWKSNKIKKIIDVIIIITIYMAFIYLIFENEILTFMSKYLNINL